MLLEILTFGTSFKPQNYFAQQHLGLAGNPIVGVRHLSGLRGLPSLMELTLDDIHFGTCPVVTKEGYRHFIMCCLRQVGHELVRTHSVVFAGRRPLPRFRKPTRVNARIKTDPATRW